ncbi:DUF975 family protein [Wenyingzhuangia sp. IMCC45574]
MATENIKLMQSARESLKGKWAIAVVGVLLHSLIISVGSYVSLIIAGPLSLGISLFALNISRGNEVKIEQIFKGFNHFTNTLVAYLLYILYVFLWSLLFLIPGIIKALAFSMTFFILADNPELGYMEALEQSEQMMNGYKWKLFKLNLRFFGWALVCILTLGIGFFFLAPYVKVTYAKFYEDLNVADNLDAIGEPVNI